MNRIVLKIILISAVLAATLTSCSDEPTVQSYYVDSQEKSGFITTTIPKTILGIDESKLSPESQKTYASVNKVNLLVLPASEGKEQLVKQETEAFNDILKKGNYKTLMTHNADGMKARFVYEGDTDSIDELIVFGSADGMGMGVARITGEDMNIGNLLKMMKELDASDINPANLKGVLQGMGMDLDNNKDKPADSTTASSNEVKNL